jgi:hypothetical protein
MNQFQKEKTAPLCIQSEGQRCERILEWEDEEGKIRKDPPYLSPRNFLALEIYQKIIATSQLQKIEYKKNKQHRIAYLPSLEKLEIYLSLYTPEMDQDEVDLLLDKIRLLFRYDFNKTIGS